MTAAEQSPGEQRSYRQRIKGPFVSGLAIAVPVLITLVVFRVAMSFILDSVGPLAGAIRAIPGVAIPPGLAAELAAMSVLVVFIFLVALSPRASGGRADWNGGWTRLCPLSPASDRCTAVSTR
ncbi:hypothetical protein GJ629_10475 [Halapricum sp. CBA1109]|uniref:hypothetical protein n=1 Tax=Halapricum sp. CBA1109 TaxID=2668068 RepID=UPI0012FC0507|nr:hypothetical protein [Halapricum sp. CBA1109]MUV90266.1 hypothetical protein [Halapricum sp. CBA1109]